MERRLTIEEHNVSIHQMSVHHVTLEEFEGFSVQMFERNGASVGPLDRLCTRILIRAVLDQRVQLLDVERRDLLGIREVGRDLHGHTEFRHGDVGIRCNP